jgi:hypothetical protein
LAFSVVSADCGDIEIGGFISGLKGVFHGLKNFTRALRAQAAGVFFCCQGIFF